MNPLLSGSLPETVEICGQDVTINTDFRTCILFEQLLQDRSVAVTVKTNTAIEMFFNDLIVPDREAAVNGILWFYSGGKYRANEEKKAPSKQPKRIYDYDVDANLIYAAFLDQYGVDLQEVDYLHWWKFCAMQAGLKSDCEFVHVMSYRALDLSQIKAKDARARYSKLKTLYALPDNRTQEQKVADAGAAFGGCMSK